MPWNDQGSEGGRQKLEKGILGFIDFSFSSFVSEHIVSPPPAPFSFPCLFTLLDYIKFPPYFSFMMRANCTTARIVTTGRKGCTIW